MEIVETGNCGKWILWKIEIMGNGDCGKRKIVKKGNCVK